MAQPLVITLRLDASSEALLTSLRAKYFPRHRNFLPSHITFFHALPATSQDIVKTKLQETCYNTSIFDVSVTSPFPLGKKGVALNVASLDITSLHQLLLAHWKREGIQLTEQDDNPRIRAHVTVQNKVGEYEAKETLTELKAIWERQIAVAEGLRLWRYETRGDWTFLQEFLFEKR